MSSWVPLRTAPPEPLCVPSTSYTITGSPICAFWVRERRCGGQSSRGRALRRLRCRASQATQTYHNAFKLLHQSSRVTEPAVASDAVGQQHRQKSRPRSQSKSAIQSGDTASPLPDGPSAARQLQPSNSTGDAISPPSTAPNPFPSPTRGGPINQSNIHSSTSSSNSTLGGFDAGTEDVRPYVPHSVSLPHWQPPPTSLQHRTALTREITKCPTYTRLHQMIMDNAADFNTYHTCAALSRILALHNEGLTPRESRLFKEGCSTLQTILRRQLPELQARSLVVAAYSLARLELPDRELLAGLAAAVEPHLSALQPQGLSSLLWAFARQNHQPPPKWMDALLSACAADLPAFAPRDIATVIWALARLHYKVAPARLQQLLEHTQANIGSFCGRSLSNVVYSLALSQQHPGEEWMKAAQTRAVALGPGAFSPQGMTQMAWGIAKLRTTPTTAFMDLVMEHASQRLPPSPNERLRQEQQQQQGGSRGVGDGSSGSSTGSPVRERRQGRYSGLDLATLMYVLASLGVQPRADMGRRLLAAVQWELPSLEPNGMCNCLWACARLRLFPTKMWLSAFFDASYRQLAYFKPVDLSQTLWALARLQASPPAPWMSSVMTRLQHSASMFSPVEVATTMWALARLGVRGEQMPSEVLALFFIATDRRLSSFKPQELSSLIWALAHMRRRPDKEWIAEFLKVTYHRLASMNGWCLGTLAWSLAELSLLPPPAWIYNYVNAARALMNTTPLPLPLPQSSQGGGATSSSGNGNGSQTTMFGPSSSSSSGSSPAGAGGGLSAMDLGQIITSLRRLNGSSSSKSGGVGSSRGGLAKVEEFLAEAEEHLAAMEAGSGAYARQQLGAFLAMSSKQAGLAVVVPPMAPEPNGDMGGDADVLFAAGLNGSSGAVISSAVEAAEAEATASGNATAAAAAAVEPKASWKRNRRRQRRSGAAALEQGSLIRSSSLEKRAAQGKGPVAGKLIAATVAGKAVYAGRTGGGDRAHVAITSFAPATATASAAGTGSSSSSSSSPSSHDVTRALNGGARVTLAVAPDVRVDLGCDLNVELSVLSSSSSSGPVLWRPTVPTTGGTGAGGKNSADGNGNGSAGGTGGACDSAPNGSAAGSEDDVSTSMAEIKRRLLAV